MKKIFINILAVIGLLALIVHTLQFYYSGSLLRKQVFMPSDVSVTATILSPNGLYQAVEFTQVGGANVSFYCFIDVSIISSKEPAKSAWGDNNSIAQSSCDGISKIFWKADDELVIPINATIGVMGIDAMKLKGYAQGTIRIDYPEIK